MEKKYKSKFAVLRKIKNPLVLENLKIPNPNTNQLLVKINYSYICGTQLNEINGNKGFDKFIPHTLGHEASGEVLKIGKEINNFKIGDKIILSWIKTKEKDSKNLFYYDEKNKIVNSGQVSTFSKFALVSKNRVYKVPKKLPMDLAALFGCAIPTGFGIVFKYLNKVNKDDHVVIYGAGGIGIMSIIALRLRGIKNIYAIDKNKKNLKIAKSFGCVKTYSLNEFSNKIKTQKINKNFIKYNIEVSGSKLMMEMAIKNLSTQGLCVLAGNIKRGLKIKIDPYDLIFGKKIYGFSGNDISLEKNLKRYNQLLNKINFNKLRKIFKVYKFKNINRAVDDFKNGKILRPLIKF